MADLLLDRWKKTKEKLSKINNNSSNKTTSNKTTSNKTTSNKTTSNSGSFVGPVQNNTFSTSSGLANYLKNNSSGSTKNSQYTAQTLGNTYDANMNYQAIINDAIASGDYMTAAKAEQLRNQKILAQGLDYDRTNTYGGYLDGSDIDLSIVGRNQIANGASKDDVENTYWARASKIAGSNDLSQYKDDYVQQMMLQYMADQAREENQPEEFEFEEEKPTEPKSDPRIDVLLDELLNREDFSYDLLNDPLYQQYADQYRREGDRAMRETMAEAAAGAGGMNTYAMTAANQANNYYNAQLNNIVPELYNLAYSKYLNDIEQEVQNLGILQNMDATQYARYRDTVNDWYNDRNFAYGKYYDDVQQGNWNTTFDYNALMSNRNFANNEMWANKEWNYNDAWKNKEWDYNDAWANKEWDANQADKELANNRYDQEIAKEEVWKYISLGVTPSADLIAKAGMTEADVALAVAAIKAEQNTSGGSSGGGSSYKNPSSGGNGYTDDTGEGNGYTGDKVTTEKEDEDNESKQEPQQSSDDYTIGNTHGEDWVAVSGMGRMTYQELETAVNNGEVIETIDEESKTLYYKKA